MEQDNKFSEKKLRQYGITSAMAGGIYEGDLTVKELLSWGDFGIGAPNYLNGELTVVDGKAWHTVVGKESPEETAEADDAEKLAHAFALRFSPDFSFELEGVVDQRSMEERISAQLDNPNGMYAFRITGKFEQMSTRAFPPLPKDCHTPTSELMGREHVFEYADTEGIIVTTWIPAWLDGINIPGYHSHFISTDGTQGGHVLSFTGRDMKVEVCIVTGLCLSVQYSDEFRRFNFNKVSSDDIHRLEAGK